MPSMCRKHSRVTEKPRIGTINTWVIVNGQLPDEAFIQAMITATEAKTKALQTESIKDPLTGTIATGTSTDSLLVAATQQGEFLPYAGPITPLGKLIGHGVYDCTVGRSVPIKKRKGGRLDSCTFYRHRDWFSARQNHWRSTELATSCSLDWHVYFQID